MPTSALHLTFSKSKKNFFKRRRKRCRRRRGQRICSTSTRQTTTGCSGTRRCITRPPTSRFAGGCGCGRVVVVVCWQSAHQVKLANVLLLDVKTNVGHSSGFTAQVRYWMLPQAASFNEARLKQKRSISSFGGVRPQRKKRLAA